MSSEICNHQKMERPVEYNTQSGVCSVDKTVWNPPKGAAFKKYPATTIQYCFKTDDPRNLTVDMFLTCHGATHLDIETAERHHTGLDCYHPVVHAASATFCDNVPISRLDDLLTTGAELCDYSQKRFPPMREKATDLRYIFGPVRSV